MKAKKWIEQKDIKGNKFHGETILPIGYACELMELYSAEQNESMMKMILKLKEICEGEIPEFNIPELNDLIKESGY